MMNVDLDNGILVIRFGVPLTITNNT